MKIKMFCLACLAVVLSLVFCTAYGEQVNETGWLKVYYLSIYPEPVHDNRIEETGGVYPWLLHYSKRSGDFYYIDEGCKSVGIGWVYFPESVIAGDSHSGVVLSEKDVSELLGKGNTFLYWYGEKSDSLKEIQEKLTIYMHSDEVSPDDWWYVNVTGVYDEATTSAIRTFQQVNYLLPTGLLDRKTSYYKLCTVGADNSIRLDKDAAFTEDWVEVYGNLEPDWLYCHTDSTRELYTIESAYTVNGITWYGLNPVTLFNDTLNDRGMTYVSSHLMSFKGDEQFRPATAAFTNPAFAAQTRTVVIPKLEKKGENSGQESKTNTDTGREAAAPVVAVNNGELTVRDTSHAAEIIFRSDGTFMLKSPGGNEQGTFRLTNGQIMLTSETGMELPIGADGTFSYPIGDLVFEFRINAEEMEKLTAMLKKT